MPDTVEKGGKTTAEVLRTTLWRLTIATALLYVIIFGAGLKIYLDQRNTNRALCTLRDDLGSRMTSSIQFLADHPNGTAGISAKIIADSIDNQLHTIRALQGLDCAHVIQVKATPTPKVP